ncbi:MAG: tripartite tricarboxylate transporter substrate binding protein [Pseudomonadota bacterium]
MKAPTWVMAGAAALACGGAATGAAAAEAWVPNKPVRIVAVSTPAGSLDATARAVAEHLGKAWGQAVVVDNRPGANGTIAAGIVAKAPADGYTLLYSTRVISMNAALYKLPFDTRALVPVAMILNQPTLLVVGKRFAAHDLPGFMKLARENPGKYSFGSTGNGSVPHLAGESFMKISGVKLIHVPYKGGAPVMNDIMGGTIDMTFGSVGSTMPQIRDGSVVPLAVAAKQRAPQLPDVPTFAEAGVPGYYVDSWYGLFAPPGTPPEIVQAISEETNRYLRSPEAAKKFGVMGAVPAESTPASFRADFDGDLVMYRDMARELNLKAE